MGWERYVHSNEAKAGQRRSSRESGAAYACVCDAVVCKVQSASSLLLLLGWGSRLPDPFPVREERHQSARAPHHTTTTTTAADSVCVFPRWQCAEPPCRAPRCVRDPLYCCWPGCAPFLSFSLGACCCWRVCVCVGTSGGVEWYACARRGAPQPR